jgi:hypothetical protein
MKNTLAAAAKTSLCQDWAARAPTGTKTRPMARQKPAKLCTAGSTANSIVPASIVAKRMLSMKVWAPA